MAIWTCDSCGGENPEGMRFCGHCGAQAVTTSEEFERVGHGAGRALGYATLAETLVHAGELDEALEYSHKALELVRSIKHPLATADAIQAIAAIRLRQGDFDEAAARAEEAAALFLDVDAAPLASDALAIAAEAWEKAGDRDRADETSARARSRIGA